MPTPSTGSTLSQNRQAVSAEVYGEWNQRRLSLSEPVIYPKSQSQRHRLRKVLQSSFLFSSLEVDSLHFEAILDAMVEIAAEPGEECIRQGEPGDFLCVVESGELDCIKKFEV